MEALAEASVVDAQGAVADVEDFLAMMEVGLILLQNQAASRTDFCQTAIAQFHTGIDIASSFPRS